MAAALLLWLRLWPGAAASLPSETNPVPIFGEPALFPAGTYWLRRNARVTVATADPMPVFCVNGPAPIPIG